MRPLLRTTVQASRLAAELGLTLEGDDVELEGLCSLSDPQRASLTFMTRAVDVALPERVCVLSATRPSSAAVWLATERARLDFVKAQHVLERLAGFRRPEAAPEIHPSVQMGEHVSIGRGVVIGEGTRIGHSVTIADDVQIGRDCWIKSNTVIGESGFGFERDEDGTPIHMLHFGGVVIGDRVVLGSLNTVVSGALGPTVVGDDVKTDDHVHIAHNCKIGKKTLLTACAELSGGVVIGEQAWIGPNVSVKDKVKIGDRAFIGIGAVVLRDVADGATVVGNPARVLEKR